MGSHCQFLAVNLRRLKSKCLKHQFWNVFIWYQTSKARKEKTVAVLKEVQESAKIQPGKKGWQMMRNVWTNSIWAYCKAWNMQCFPLSLVQLRCRCLVFQAVCSLENLIFNGLPKFWEFDLVLFSKPEAELKTSIQCNVTFSYRKAWKNALDSMGPLLKAKSIVST